MRDTELTPNPGSTLCLACGLCCNGVIFADLKLKRGETFPWSRIPAKTHPIGQVVPAPEPPGGRKILQPCPAFDGCRCTIYEQRPSHCRKFECLLLQRVTAGHLPNSTAISTVRNTRQKAETIRTLLQRLGDTDEQLPLARRFSRTEKRLATIGARGEAADNFQQLTLAVHELMLVLAREFYH